MSGLPELYHLYESRLVRCLRWAIKSTPKSPLKAGEERHRCSARCYPSPRKSTKARIETRRPSVQVSPPSKVHYVTNQHRCVVIIIYSLPRIVSPHFKPTIKTTPSQPPQVASTSRNGRTNVSNDTPVKHKFSWFYLFFFFFTFFNFLDFFGRKPEHPGVNSRGHGEPSDTQNPHTKPSCRPALLRRRYK